MECQRIFETVLPLWFLFNKVCFSHFKVKPEGHQPSLPRHLWSVFWLQDAKNCRELGMGVEGWGESMDLEVA